MQTENQHGHGARSQTVLELVSDREIVITRTVAAPPRIAFEAWTAPEHLRRWWAPKSRGVTLSECHVDLRPGGSYRYVMRRDNGQEMAFSGTYSDVSPPRRLAYTEIFEPMRQMGGVDVIVTFDAAEGGTCIVSRSTYPSKQVRDGILATGMESGMREAMDQLDALVTELAASRF